MGNQIVGRRKAKTYMNKLLELLKGYVSEGKLTAEDLSVAQTQIESIKVKLNEKDTQIKELGDKLKPYEEQEQESALKEAFTKAGGHESQFENFKDAGGTLENAAEKIGRFSMLKDAVEEFDSGDIAKITGEAGAEAGAEAEGSLLA